MKRIIRTKCLTFLIWHKLQYHKKKKKKKKKKKTSITNKNWNDTLTIELIYNFGYTLQQTNGFYFWLLKITRMKDMTY